MASTEGATSGTHDGGAPSHPRGDGNRGRGRGRGGPRGRSRVEGHRGGGRGGRGRGGGNLPAAHTPAASTPDEKTGDDAKPPQAAKLPTFKTRNQGQDEAADPEEEVCFICASPIDHHSIAPCNHQTCHICSLRMRALYKDQNCPHCRTAAPYVIYTDDNTKRFEEYTNKDITSTDENIGIKYAGEDIVGDTILLLRYNCPDADCDYAGFGWPDLHRHVRLIHNKKMCDLCTRNKKVFTHEHDMYTDKELGEHMKRGDDAIGAVGNTGFKGHPLCGFCGERFYDDDKLYEHCRNKHERCFICDRRDSRQPHYFVDYNALEAHFKKDHFTCLDRECLEKKFVVFESEVDLKAHQLSEHGSSLQKDARRDARHVDMSNFDFRTSYQQERRGGRGGGGGDGRDQQRRRNPDPNAEPLPVSSAQPLRRDELAFQRQMAINSNSASGPSRVVPQPPRPSPNQNAPQPPRIPASQPMVDAMENISINDLSSLTPAQRASLTRHGAVLERASNLLGSNPSKMATFRSYISNYNKGSMTSEQVIAAFFALFSETSSTALGTLVREVADLFEDKKKGELLRKSWQNWRATNEDYPSLPSLGGMHGATTASSGWAAAAAATATPGQGSAVNAAAQAQHSTRVLKLKNSTRRASSGSIRSLGSASSSTLSSYAPSRPVASSSSAFPALPSAGRASQPTQPTWIGGTAPAVGTPRNTAPRSSVTTAAQRAGGGGGGGGGGSRTNNGEDAFPALPAAPKPMTTIFGYGRGMVRRDVGNQDTGFNWNAGASGSADAAGASSGGEPAEGEGGGGKGKKKNKKQVLVQWG